MYAHPLKRGEVYLVQFPLPNPKKQLGNTITKYVVCLQEGQIITNRPLFTALKTTSIKDAHAKLYPTDVVLSPQESTTENGVIIQCDYVHTIAKQQIVKKAYTVPTEKMEEVDRLLAFAVGLVKIEDIVGR